MSVFLFLVFAWARRVCVCFVKMARRTCVASTCVGTKKTGERGAKTGQNRRERSSAEKKKKQRLLTLLPPPSPLHLSLTGSYPGSSFTNHGCPRGQALREMDVRRRRGTNRGRPAGRRAPLPFAARHRPSPSRHGARTRTRAMHGAGGSVIGGAQGVGESVENGPPLDLAVSPPPLRRSPPLPAPPPSPPTPLSRLTTSPSRTTSPSSRAAPPRPPSSCPTPRAATRSGASARRSARLWSGESRD